MNPKVHAETPAAEDSLSRLIHSREPALLRQAASDRRLNEDLALTLLQRRDLPHLALEDLSKNAAVMKHRRVIMALVTHIRTPRHVALPIIRRLFTFEMMQIALTPAVAADLKRFSEEQLVARLESLSAGERIALAKRSPTRIAAALLLDASPSVIEAALENPYLTEAWIVKAIMSQDAPQSLVDGLCHHHKWSLRREIRAALLRNEKTPMASAIAFAEVMSSHALREILRNSRLPANVKDYLSRVLEDRAQSAK